MIYKTPLRIKGWQPLRLTSTVVIFLIHIFAFAQNTSLLPLQFMVLPTPQYVTVHAGQALATSDISCLVVDPKLELPVLKGEMKRIKVIYNEDYTAKLGVPVILSIKPDLSEFSSDEGYVLRLATNSVEIQAKTEVGLFYGCKTMSQLIADANMHKIAIPPMTIIDYPDLEFRGIHIDVKHHLSNMKTYYDIIDRLSDYNINKVVFEFEDKLRYKRQPKIGASHAISIEEMAALTNYARKRNIEISPLIQGLGHATFILKHREYAYLREMPNSYWAFCPLHDGTYEVLFDMYLDAIEATPGSRYLHIGGDEIGSIGICHRCLDAKLNGTLAFNLHWLEKISDFLKEHNRIPIFWDDMPLKEADVFLLTLDKRVKDEDVEHLWRDREKELEEHMPKFVKHGILNRWHYQHGFLPMHKRLVEWYGEKKYPYIVASATQHGPFTIFPPNNLEDVRSLIKLGAKNGTIGVLNTAWDDRSLHSETFWRGHVAAAEQSWAGEGSTENADFDDRFLWREYGVTFANYDSLYNKLREGATFWDQAYLKESRRSHQKNNMYPLRLDGYSVDQFEGSDIDFADKLINLPYTDKPGKWSEEYKTLIRTANKLLDQQEETGNALDYLYRHSVKNRYTWELYQSLYDFQLTAPQLIMALHKFDISIETDRQTHIDDLLAKLETFQQVWTRLMKVYGKTRFMSYPADYVEDRYWQLASQREDHTWMIQVEERFHDKIRKWLQSIGDTVHETRVSSNTWGGFELVSIPSTLDGVIQKAYFKGSTSSRPKPLIVSLHTWSGDYAQEDSIAMYLRHADVNYIHPDFRGSNNNPLACGSKYVISDIDEAISYAISNGNVDMDNIYVIGVSGGGYATLLALMNSIHPISRFMAWVPISDLVDWYLECDSTGRHYAQDILASTSSKGNELNYPEARLRSPYFQKTPLEKLKGSTVEIYAGVNDGLSGSVSFEQSIKFYNKLISDMGNTNNSQRVSSAEIDMLKQRRSNFSSSARRIGDRKVLLERSYKNVSLVIFDGGHEMLYNPVFEKLSLWSNSLQ